jgi:hypothetical protein
MASALLFSPGGMHLITCFDLPMKEHNMETSRQSSSLFVRQSSGLVREASALDAMIFNAVFSAPVGATLAFGIFYALGTSPGADIVQALLIAFVVNIPVRIYTQYEPVLMVSGALKRSNPHGTVYHTRAVSQRMYSC